MKKVLQLKKKKQYFTGAIPSKDLDLPSEASPCSKLNIVTFSCLVLHGNKKKIMVVFVHVLRISDH